MVGFLTLTCAGIIIGGAIISILDDEENFIFKVVLVAGIIAAICSIISTIIEFSFYDTNSAHSESLKAVIDEKYFTEQKIDNKVTYVEIRDKAGNIYKLEASPKNE